MEGGREAREREGGKEKENIHITLIVCCYNCSVLLLGIVFDLLLCLVYKLNFVISMYM